MFAQTFIHLFKGMQFLVVEEISEGSSRIVVGNDVFLNVLARNKFPSCNIPFFPPTNSHHFNA